MIRLEWLFLMQFIMGGLMIILLQKQMQMKKQLEEIVREVENYISYITEDVTEEPSKKIDADAQNRLIQSVLGEYFQ